MADSSPDVEFRQGEGGPGSTADALPQGAATATNAALPSEGGVPDMAAAMGPAVPAPSFPTGATSEDKPFSISGDDEAVLFEGDAEGVGTGPRLPQGRLPDSVVRWLPTMKAAAAEPTAPDSLRAIYAAAVNSLDQELR